MTARADAKGSVPAYLINFVAKRTPRMWYDRISRFCAQQQLLKAKEEEEQGLALQQ
jgi:hypothetical protein